MLSITCHNLTGFLRKDDDDDDDADDDKDEDEDEDIDDGDDFASHGNGFMWQSKYQETYFKICQYNATNIYFNFHQIYQHIISAYVRINCQC